MSKDNSMSEADLIAHACRDLGEKEEDVSTIEEAMEAWWGHGFSDEQTGSVTEPPFEHVFRVHRWLMWTDEQGFKTVDEYDNEDEAHQAFEKAETDLYADIPNPEDYMMSDTRDGVGVSEYEGKFLGSFPTRDEAEAFILERMKAESFWPNVWFVSDHGNIHSVVLEVQDA